MSSLRCFHVTVLRKTGIRKYNSIEMTSMPVLPGSSTLPDSNTEAVSAKLHELSWTNDVDLEEKLHEHGNHVSDYIIYMGSHPPDHTTPAV